MRLDGDPEHQPTPPDILTYFRERWVGTEAELEAALELFLTDVLYPDMPEHKLASEYRVEALDYFSNYYG